jgi:hypothetical protein
MSNFTIKLSEAIQLKEEIQEKLTRYQFTLRNENSIPSGRKRNYDLKKLVKDEEDLRQKMVTLKLLIQVANLTVPDGEKESIQYFIFTLSEKDRQVKNLMVMPTDEGPLVLNSTSSTTVKYTVIFTQKDKDEWIQKLKKECREISNKLTKFNGETKVNLPFDPKKI